MPCNKHVFQKLMETEDKERGEIKWLLETLAHLQDWLNEDDRTLKQSELDKLVKRYKELQSSNRMLISKTNKIEMQYKLEQELDQVRAILNIIHVFLILNVNHNIKNQNCSLMTRQ